MTPLSRIAIITLLIANNVHPTLAIGQNDAINPAQATPVACPEPAQVSALHLYGTWHASWDGLKGGATLTFGRNPNHPDGVGGIIRRDAGLPPPEALVAGDVDNGVFALEESTDGKAISATWRGNVVAGSCGREIAGLWTRTSDRQEARFVLRKRPGWN